MFCGDFGGDGGRGNSSGGDLKCDMVSIIVSVVVMVVNVVVIQLLVYAMAGVGWMRLKLWLISPPASHLLPPVVRTCLALLMS